MEAVARGPIKEVVWNLTVIRADGTVIPLGDVTSSNWKYKPWKRLGAWYRITRANREHRRR